MDRINDLWDRSLDKRRVRGLVPCCGQNGYRAHVPQHPIDTYRYIKLKYLCRPKKKHILMTTNLAAVCLCKETFRLSISTYYITQLINHFHTRTTISHASKYCKYQERIL